MLVVHQELEICLNVQIYKDHDTNQMKILEVLRAFRQGVGSSRVAQCFKDLMLALWEDGASIRGFAWWVEDLALPQAAAEIKDSAWTWCGCGCGCGLELLL